MYVVPPRKLIRFNGRLYHAGDVVPGYTPPEDKPAPVKEKPKKSKKKSRTPAPKPEPKSDVAVDDILESLEPADAEDGVKDTTTNPDGDILSEEA